MADTIALANLMGTWHLAHSTLSTWKPGKKRVNPRILKAGFTEKNGVATWSDTTVYEEPGWFCRALVERSIPLQDTLVNTNPLTYKFAGKGFFCFIKGECTVLAHDPDFAEYLVAHFGATLASEEAMEILTRSPDGLPDQRLEEVMAALPADHQEFARAKGLTRTPQQRNGN